MAFQREAQARVAMGSMGLCRVTICGGESRPTWDRCYPSFSLRYFSSPWFGVRLPSLLFSYEIIKRSLLWWYCCALYSCFALSLGSADNTVQPFDSLRSRDLAGSAISLTFIL